MATKTDTVTVRHAAQPDAAGIMDGREVARALIRQALSVLTPYVDGCPVCTYALLAGIGWETLTEDTKTGKIDAAVHADGVCVTIEAMTAHVGHARPSTFVMLDRFGQAHHREHPEGLPQHWTEATAHE